ncbi:unnamed protein product [Rotaria sp. Silwood2]|nr:unnamed protein product [Rotaria sp. Silwood2]
MRSFFYELKISLKKFANTNESNFQAVVPDLLVQLLLICVNYSLLNFGEVHCISNLSFIFKLHFLTHINNQIPTIEETMSDYDVSSHFIYHIAEFLVILSHDILHSKQVLNVQEIFE